jgi:hypothetical protein
LKELFLEYEATFDYIVAKILKYSTSRFYDLSPTAGRVVSTTVFQLLECLFFKPKILAFDIW